MTTDLEPYGAHGRRLKGIPILEAAHHADQLPMLIRIHVTPTFNRVASEISQAFTLVARRVTQALEDVGPIWKRLAKAFQLMGCDHPSAVRVHGSAQVCTACGDLVSPVWGEGS